MKYIVIEPPTARAKALVARRVVGGKYYVIAECRLRENAQKIADALNGEA